jgi:ribosomal protein S18 acetylase RimI-like enzyme
VASLASLAAIVNAYSLATVGTRRALVDERGELRLARYAPPNANWRLANGGAACHVARPPHVVHEVSVYAGTPELLASVEAGARAELELAPEGTRVVAQAMVLENDVPTRRLLEAAGYAVVRTWTHLEVELDAEPPAPTWPDGIFVRSFDQTREWPAVGRALDEAFTDHWGEIPAPPGEADDDEADDDADDDPYSNSRDFCFVAWAHGEVAGVLLGNQKTVEWPDSGKVGTVIVRRPYRRSGLATALLLHAFAAFHRHGIRRVITDTDSESFTAGPVLYEGVGMREYRRELVYEKELRSGRELRRLV